MCCICKNRQKGYYVTYHMSKKCSTFALDFETQTQKLYDYETD